MFVTMSPKEHLLTILYLVSPEDISVLDEAPLSDDILPVAAAKGSSEM